MASPATSLPGGYKTGQCVPICLFLPVKYLFSLLEHAYNIINFVKTTGASDNISHLAFYDIMPQKLRDRILNGSSFCGIILRGCAYCQH